MVYIEALLSQGKGGREGRIEGESKVEKGRRGRERERKGGEGGKEGRGEEKRKVKWERGKGGRIG